MSKEKKIYFIGDSITFVNDFLNEETTETVESVEFCWKSNYGEICIYTKYITDKNNTVIDCMGDYESVKQFENKEPMKSFINKGVQK